MIAVSNELRSKFWVRMEVYIFFLNSDGNTDNSFKTKCQTGKNVSKILSYVAHAGVAQSLEASHFYIRITPLAQYVTSFLPNIHV